MEIFRRDPEFKETYLWVDEMYSNIDIKLTSHEIIQIMIELIETGIINKK